MSLRQHGTLYVLGLTQLRLSASQRHVFACGSKVLTDLPKAHCANCVRPTRIAAEIFSDLEKSNHRANKL
jgi:hypothetical protein